MARAKTLETRHRLSPREGVNAQANCCKRTRQTDRQIEGVVGEEGRRRRRSGYLCEGLQNASAKAFFEVREKGDAVGQVEEELAGQDGLGQEVESRGAQQVVHHDVVVLRQDVLVREVAQLATSLAVQCGRGYRDVEAGREEVVCAVQERERSREVGVGGGGGGGG